jgi:GTP-binding protein
MGSRFEIKQVEFDQSATRPVEYPPSRFPQIAFAGRSNVGKSSLLNVVANRKAIARVSGTPGHTRLLNFFVVNRTIHFVDLPGYGFAKAPKDERAKWEKMISTFVERNPCLRGVVALFDVRRELSPEDRVLLDWLSYYDVPVIAVLTKADKLARSHQVNALRKMEQEFAKWNPVAVVLFSATTRVGRDELLGCIGRLLYPEP